KSHASEISAKRQSLEVQKERIFKRRKKIVELYLNEAITKDFFDLEHGKLKNELTLLEGDIRKLEELVVTQDELNVRKQSLALLREKLMHKLNVASDKAKHEILHELVNEIVVKGEELTIEIAMPYTGSFAGQPTHGLPRKHTFS